MQNCDAVVSTIYVTIVNIHTHQNLFLMTCLNRQRLQFLRMRDIDVDTLKRIESYEFNTRNDEEHETKAKDETKFKLFFFII